MSNRACAACRSSARARAGRSGPRPPGAPRAAARPAAPAAKAVPISNRRTSATWLAQLASTRRTRPGSSRRRSQASSADERVEQPDAVRPVGRAQRQADDLVEPLGHEPAAHGRGGPPPRARRAACRPESGAGRTGSCRSRGAGRSPRSGRSRAGGPAASPARPPRCGRPPACSPPWRRWRPDAARASCQGSSTPSTWATRAGRRKIRGGLRGLGPEIQRRARPASRPRWPARARCSAASRPRRPSGRCRARSGSSPRC